MDLTNYLGKNIFETLSVIRQEHMVDYNKIEGDEFIQLPECGYYLQSKNGTGIISDIRIFFEEYEGFFPSNPDCRGKYINVNKFSDIEILLGKHIKEIRSLKIPGMSPTLPGKQYVDGSLVVSAHAKNSDNVTFIHIKSSVS